MIISLYNEHKSVRKISELTGNSRDVISRKLAENGIYDFVKISDDEVKRICVLYSEGKTIKEIHSITAVGAKQINYLLIAKKLIRPRTSKVKKQEDIFEVIDTEEKAYWLGFLYADGYVNEKNVCLELAIKDYEHLIKFKSFMKTNATINKKIIKLKDKTFINYRIHISSKKIVNDLIRHGCVQKKSNILTFPTMLPQELICHFIRGYFDGDGSVGVYERKNGLKSYEVKVVGTEEFLTGIQNVFFEELNLNPVKLYQKKSNKAFQLQKGGRINFLTIRDYMYNNATVYLDRKYRVFYDVNSPHI